MTESEIIQKYRAAQQMISDLNKPRGTAGSRDWIMSIPPRPEVDPDLVIDAALQTIPFLLSVIKCGKQLEPKKTAYVQALEEIPDDAILFGCIADAENFRQKQQFPEDWPIVKVTKEVFPILEVDMYMVRKIFQSGLTGEDYRITLLRRCFDVLNRAHNLGDAELVDLRADLLQFLYGRKR